jgi:predicted nucleic acid-binding protein
MKGKGLFSEVVVIEKVIKEGWIEIVEANSKEVKKLKIAFPNLGKGEIESLVICKEKNLPVLLDDSQARRTAEILNIEAHGTLFVILKAYKNKLISKKRICLVN